MIKETIRAVLGHHYQKNGRIAIQEKRWKDAIVNIDKALKFLPLDTSCLNNKGVALWKLGKINEAIECFNMVINRYTNFENDTLYFEGDSEEYLKYNYTSALNNLGSLLSQIGKKKEAIILHKQALRLDPNRKSAIHNLRVGLTTIPKNSVIHKDIFKSVEQTNGPETATKVILDEIEEYNNTLKKKPKSIITLINKGTALAEINKFDDALSCYDKVLKIEPSNIAALLNKGSILGRIGEYKEAIHYFDKVLKLEPKNEMALEHKKIASGLIRRK